MGSRKESILEVSELGLSLGFGFGSDSGSVLVLASALVPFHDALSLKNNGFFERRFSYV